MSIYTACSMLSIKNYDEKLKKKSVSRPYIIYAKHAVLYVYNI